MQIDGKAGYDPGSESTIIRLERDFFIRYLSLSKNDNIASCIIQSVDEK